MTQPGGEKELPFLRLLAYALPGLPGAAALLPLYIYLPTYYAEDLGLGLAGVGLVLLAARLWDVVSDPIVGLASDHIRTRFGRRRPWIVAGTPLVVLGILKLFLPGEDSGLASLFFWTALLYLGITALTLNHNAWGAELSDDHHGRSRITGLREALVVVGTLLAAGLPALLGTGPGESLHVIAWGVAFVLPMSVCIAVICVGERSDTCGRNIAWRQGWKLLWRNGPFRRLILAYLINGVANGLPATLFFLFVRHVLDASEWHQGLLLLTYFSSGVAAIPLWLWLSRRFGKHRVWLAAMAWACFWFLPVPLLGSGDIAWFYAVCVLTGLSLGADLSLPASMQADVIELDRLKSGAGRAGLFFALWGMATKLALALAVGIAFPLLSLAGLESEAGTMPGSTALLALALLYALLPVILKSVAIACVWRYPLDAPTQARIRRLVERRRRFAAMEA